MKFPTNILFYHFTDFKPNRVSSEIPMQISNKACFNALISCTINMVFKNEMVKFNEVDV